MWLGILSPILALLINTVIQMICFQLVRSVGLFKSIVLGFLSGFICLGAIQIIIYADMASRADLLCLTSLNSIAYVLLSYCYWAYINLGETSLRIRILRDMYEAKRPFKMEEMLDIYNPRQMYETRMLRLVKHGQILLLNERYYTEKSILLYVSKLIVIIKFLITGKRSEFD